MAYGFVQSASGKGAGLSTLTITYATQNVALGNKLIAHGNAGTTQVISSIKDGAGNTFTAAYNVGGSPGGGNLAGGLFFIDVPSGDAGTKPSITLTAATGTDLGMVIEEWSGLAPGNTTALAVDGTAATALETPTTSQAQPAYTSTAANELLFSVLADNGNSVTYTAPYSNTDPHNINGDANDDVIVSWQNSTNGAESGTWTATAGTPTGSCLGVVAFKLAAPAGGGYPGFEPPPFAFPPLSRQFGPLAPFTLPGNGDFPPPVTNPYPVMALPATTSAFTVTRSTGPGDGITLLANVGAVITSVTDSQGNTWLNAQSDSTDDVSLWYTTYKGSPGTPTSALTAGTDTITVTGSASGLFMITGVKGVAPYAADKNPAFTRATGSSSVTGPASGTLTNTNEVVLAWSASSQAATVASWGGGFNRVQDGLNPANASASVAAQFPTSTASVTPTATLNASGTWAAFTLALFLNPFVPPATATAPEIGKPVQAKVPATPMARGRTARIAGVFQGLGPPVIPLRKPVVAQVPPTPRSRGRTSQASGLFDQTGPPVRQLRAPVRAQPQVPVLRGRTTSQRGIFEGQGPPSYPLRHPVRGQPQVPLLTGRTRRAAGIFQQAGPAVIPLRQPVEARQPLPQRGRTQRLAGTYTAVVLGQGPPVYPLRQPVQARQPLPARGRTERITGIFQGTGPAVIPLREPVQAHQLPHRGGQASSRTGVFEGQGPPVRQLRQPARAAWPPVTRGRNASTTGTFTFVVLGAGPPVYPLRHPVQARQPLPARGRTARIAGTFQGSGPPVRPAQGPVLQARQPLPPRGRTHSTTGTYTAVVLGAGPPVYPLRAPVRAPYPPVARGRVIRAAGTFQRTGPPVYPLRQPVGVARQQPPPPTRGRTASQRGPAGTLGPPVYARRLPVRAAWPPGRRGGQVSVLHGTFTPPPLFNKATGTATVSDPREGLARAAQDLQEGLAVIRDPNAGIVNAAADPRDGTATVSDPREGRASPAS